jgi:hypothetical protein
MHISRKWQKVPMFIAIARCSEQTATNLRRGLPLGYLNQLEQRLSETEAALYSALVTLRAMRPTTTVQASTNPDSVHKQKAARMDEWNQLPLRGWPDMERWLAGMSHQFTIEQTPNATGMEPSDGGFAIPRSPNHPNHGSIHGPDVDMNAGEPSTSYGWPPRGEVSMGSPYETHLRPPGMISSPVYSRGQATGGSDGVASPTGGGQEYTNLAISNESGPARPVESTPATRAEELSKTRPSIYF